MPEKELLDFNSEKPLIELIARYRNTVRDLEELSRAKSDLVSELRRKEAQMKLITDAVPALIAYVDRDLRYQFNNRAYEEWFGTPPEQIAGKPIREVLGEKVFEIVAPFAVRALAGEQVSFESQLPYPAGSRWVRATYMPHRTFEGEVAGYFSLVTDVTEAKKTEAELRDSAKLLRQSGARLGRQNQVLMELARTRLGDGHSLEEVLRRITEAAAETLEVGRVSIWLYQNDGQKIRCSDLFELNKNAHSQGQELLVADYPVYFEALKEERIIAAHGALSDPRTREFTKDYLLPLGITSMLDAPIWLGGKMIGIICHEQVGPPRRWFPEEQSFAASLADLISLQMEAQERFRAEEQLRASLKEKEVLLKEIHHRVKNNLQIVSSLLSLQSSYLKDPEAAETFRESQGRIRSIALVHEKLYQAKDLSQIDVEGYLRSLSGNLLRSYGIEQARIRIDLRIDKVMMDVDKAISCGLIANELVSNAMKHAFPDGAAGTIRIELQTLPSSRLRLTVADSGKGFPGGVDFRTTESLGLRLVIALTEQIKGEISLAQGQGTSFTIEFPA